MTTGDPLVGTTVAHYEVEARLGGGGMGIVYAARDTKLGRRVALKFLPPQWSHDESAKQRFIREAQAASATDHPNICTIHNIETAGGGQLFIVMARYDGETLKERLERGQLPIDDAIEITAQVAEGLAKAHAQGVVHRDIKPGNLMLTDDGVRILDFGLAKFADVRFKLTLEGSTIGTIVYMSPEQARGEEADVRSDIWAVGVVLYEMLAGEAPFKGAYPEAISHAIRNDPPPPLRAKRPDVPEALEQLVFRALHKEPAVRFQTARDLVGALRQMQGRSLPLDLRTERLAVVPGLAPASDRRTRGVRSRRATIAAAVVVGLAVGAPLWIFTPVPRTLVAVAPVVNQTGYAELDPYRLALTQELVAELSGSRVTRVVPYDRLLQIVRRFRDNGTDVSSRTAMQAIATSGGADVILVPTLLNEGGSWKARVDFRDPSTATTVASWETPPVASSLPKDAVYHLMPALAAGALEHFVASAPRRAAVAESLRRLTGRTSPRALPQLQTLDAAEAFAEGLDAAEQQEYSTAADAFRTAAMLDPRSALASAWRSRVALIMRHDKDAADSADTATRLLPGNAGESERLFVEAIAAESRRDAATAEERYRALIRQYPDDPAPVLQLADFLDRQGRGGDAITSYNQALTMDGRLVRPHVDLCRLNNPRELATAKEHGNRALAAYRALGNRGGEGQALFCLVDILRLGSAAERAEARRDAEDALKLFDRPGYSYSTARAHNYVALAAYSQVDLPAAEAAWQRALTGARAVGNTVLEPLVLMNLGAVHARLGHRAQELDYFGQSSRLFEAEGQQQRAAEIDANVGALLITYAGKLQEGVRRVENALAVSQKLGNTNFELFAVRYIASADRYAGRHADAERALNRALALAKERDLGDYIRSISLELARLRFDQGRYAGTIDLLRPALADATQATAPPARILRAQAYTRLGDFAAAQRDLEQVRRDLESGGDPELLPLLHGAMGELAYESGRREDAHASFGKATAFWTDDLPEAASVEARAYLGLLDALDGSLDRARAEVRESLDHARQMGRLALEARCRVYLARIDIGARRYDAALKTLNEIPQDEGARTLDPEIRAQVWYWRSRALAGLHDPAATADTNRARRIVNDLQAALPQPDRSRYAARPDIQMMLE